VLSLNVIPAATNAHGKYSYYWSCDQLCHVEFWTPSWGATTPWMLLTLPFVLYGIFSLSATSDPEEIVRRSDTRLEQGGTSERPEEVLLTDFANFNHRSGLIITSFEFYYLKSGIIQ